MCINHPYVFKLCGKCVQPLEEDTCPNCGASSKETRPVVIAMDTENALRFEKLTGIPISEES